MKKEALSKKLQTVFDQVVKDCSRSSTKKDLHDDANKEHSLAVMLQNVTKIFGLNVTAQFQQIHERQQPQLSYVFAQVSNAVLERAFHDGRCHSQAAYAMLELAKQKIFDACLVFSNTGNPATEHYFLIFLDDYAKQMLANHKNVKVKRFNNNVLYFDTWSKQLCYWQDFKPSNDYTRAIRGTTQSIFQSFKRIYRTEEKIIETIMWCLKEYAKYLKAVPIEDVVTQVRSTQAAVDQEYIDELTLLSNPKQCLAKLLDTIELYKTEFEKLRKVTDANLLTTTVSFFGTPTARQWKVYPKASLAKSKYNGHQVRYFTMKGTEAERATEFVTHLKAKGFVTEKKSTKNNNPSIIVDLTDSTLTFKK